MRLPMDTERIIKALYHIEEAIQKSKVHFSWMPLWIAGWLFTIGYNFQEVSEIMDAATFWGRLFYVVMWFIGWPGFLGYTISNGGG